mgnify:CR=1 FL=1
MDKHNYTVRRVSVAELFGSQERDRLLSAYADECQRNPALGRPAPNRELYEQMERQGVLRCLGGYADGDLIGYLTMLVTPPLRYSVPTAVVEGVYVDPLHRAGGPGMELIRAAREAAGAAGCPGLYISAPVDSSLDRIASRLYRHTNTTYWIDA